MLPACWLTIQIGKMRIPLLLPFILPLALAIEIIAFLPMTIISIRKRNPLLLRIATGFYLSRFIAVFILYGRKFKVSVCDDGKKVQIAGCIVTRSLPRNRQPSVYTGNIQHGTS